jgi:hypothetical protein
MIIRQHHKYILHELNPGLRGEQHQGRILVEIVAEVGNNLGEVQQSSSQPPGQKKICGFPVSSYKNLGSRVGRFEGRF